VRGRGGGSARRRGQALLVAFVALAGTVLWYRGSNPSQVLAASARRHGKEAALLADVNLSEAEAAKAAASCPGLGWQVLVAINQSAPHLDGLPADGELRSGPMALTPASYAAFDHPVAADEASTPPTTGRGGIDDLSDAAWATARLLCTAADRTPSALPAALVAYAGSPSPAKAIEADAERLGWHPPAPPKPIVVLQVTTPAERAAQAKAAREARAVATVLAFARAQLGVPYVWGGDGPAAGGGFDCSGLSQAAYRAAGIAIPRTAQAQYDFGPRVPPGQALQPGDLVFFGPEEEAGEWMAVGHVGIYIGNGEMIDATQPGSDVQIDPIQQSNPPYVGATAPWERA
jgi:cell wall-associated NlpC family hydrolase